MLKESKISLTINCYLPSNKMLRVNKSFLTGKSICLFYLTLNCNLCPKDGSILFKCPLYSNSNGKFTSRGQFNKPFLLHLKAKFLEAFQFMIKVWQLIMDA